MYFIRILKKLWQNMNPSNYPDQKKEMRKYSKWILFTFLLWLAVNLSKYILIPFSNPYEVSGPLTIIQFNPSNNVGRFLFIVFFPTAAYFLLLVIIKLLKGNYFIDRNDNGITSSDIDLKRYPDGYIRMTNKIILLTIFALLLFANLGFKTYDNAPFDTYHDGESLGPAVDYLHGKKPYKDTLLVHGVFQDPLRSVIAFNFLGKSIIHYRLITSTLAIIVIILFFITILFLFNFNIVYSVFSGICLLLLLDIVYNIPYRDTLTYIYIIFISLFYYNFIKNNFDDSFLVEKRKLFWFCFLVFFCFFIPFISLANSIDRGLYCLVGALFFSLITTVLIIKDKKSVLVFFLSGLAGAVSGIILLAIAVKGALADIFYFTIISMPSFKSLLDAFVYEFNGKLLIPVILFSALIFWLFNQFILFISNEKLAYKERIKSFIRVYYIELFMLFLSGVFFRSALDRCDLGHIHYVSSPLFLTLFYTLLKNNIGFEYDNSRLFYSVTFILLLVVAMNTVLKHSLTEKDKWWVFRTGITDEQFMPGHHRKTVDFLKNNLKSDEYFYTLTAEGTWYYFVDKPCPVKFMGTPLISPNFYQKEIIREFEEKGEKIKYIIFRNNSWTNNLDYIPNEKRYTYFIDYLKQKYQFLQMIDDQEIWEVKKK
jgi:hypothetical protein